MSTQEERRLKIVPFSGSDYSLGESLAEPDGTLSHDPAGISNKLALFFQWAEKSTVRLVMPSQDGGTLACTLFHDPDELEPTEIYLALKDRGEADKIKSLKAAVTRIELFRTCFEFRAGVLAHNEEGEANPWDLVLEVPSAVLTIKQRRLPRMNVTELERAKLPRLFWRKAGMAGDAIELKVLQMSLNAMVVQTQVGFQPGNCQIFSDTANFEAEHVTASGDRSVILMKWRDASEYGKYFDLYRLVAYPDIVARTEDRFQELFDLYRETGYLSQFAAHETPEDRRSALVETWRSIRGANHFESADYLTVDENSHLNGCSSLARAFVHDDDDFWVYHQLCSKKSPSTLQSSGHLYTWRAEYLAGYPGPLKSIVWFRSASRWLERIYVKFTKQCKGKSNLKPIRLVKGEIRREGTDEGHVGVVEKSVLLNRVMTTGGDWFAGMAPDHLNASELLNGIVACYAGTLPDVHAIGRHLLQAAGRDHGEFYVSLGLDQNFDDPAFKTMPSDRLCLIEKGDLLDFIASVEHSIAVTSRKLA